MLCPPIEIICSKQAHETAPVTALAIAELLASDNRFAIGKINIVLTFFC